MSRLLDDFLYRTTLTTVVRGKCRYDRHESVRLVDGEWWGESSRGYECNLAPEDVCPVCDATGVVEVSPGEAELAQYDGATDAQAARRRRCEACRGAGYVPGPHWPYRFPQPPPLKIRN